MRDAAVTNERLPTRGRAAVLVGESVREPNLKLLSALRTASRVGAMGLGLLGAAVFAGWVLDIKALVNFTGSITMKTNAALAFLLSGISLTVLSFEGVGSNQRRIGRACALGALCLAGATLGEHLTGSDFGIDQLFASEPPGSRAVVSPNRMGPTGSLCFLLGGAALILLAGRSGRERVVQALGAAICLIALLPTLGYLYDAQELYGVARYTGIAPVTAVALLVFGLSLLCARPGRGFVALLAAPDPGGAMVRRLVLPAMFLPIALGYLRILGERRGLYDGPLGTAAVMLFLVSIYLALLWFNGGHISAAEKRLRERQSLLDAIGNSTPDAIYLKNVEGRLLLANPATLRLVGKPVEQVIGHTDAELYEDPAVAAAILQNDRSLMQSGKPQVFEEAIDTPLGRRIMQSSKAPWKDHSGQVLGIIGISRDVTEHKQMQEALQESRAQLQRHAEELEKTVAERTAKLRETVAELEHLSYTLAHDLRAPLRAMQGFATLLLEDGAGIAAQDSKDLVRRIALSANRLNELIDDSLDYCRASLQQSPLVPIDPGKLIQGLIDTYPNLHPEKADILIQGKLPLVLGNEAALSQCFANLLGNAVKFVPPGVRPKIVVRAERVSGQAAVRLWVEDNGIGISADARERLFTVFNRLNRDFEGTGMGLAIVRKVVQRMGGRVGVESELGKGSRFWVELPAFESARVVPADKAASSSN